MSEIIDFNNPFFAIPTVSAKGMKTGNTSDAALSIPPQPMPSLNPIPTPFPLISVTPPLPGNPVPGMAYIPFQEMGMMYDDEKGLQQGTMFPVLDKPFLGKEGVNQ